MGACLNGFRYTGFCMHAITEDVVLKEGIEDKTHDLSLHSMHVLPSEHPISVSQVTTPSQIFSTSFSLPPKIYPVQKKKKMPNTVLTFSVLYCASIILQTTEKENSKLISKLRALFYIRCPFCNNTEFMLKYNFN